jgi:predicted dithiol-disulfide oxidoreductase (DUF899 family)
MLQTEILAPPHPQVVTQQEWLIERKKLLAEEKELTKRGDAVDAKRRRLPMVKIEKRYKFETPQGLLYLGDMFEGRRQLIIYHFMFEPDWDEGCPGCTGFVNALGDLSMLNERNTTFALVSRAPLEKLEAYKHAKGWDQNWYSSYGSDFNYDYHVTLDRKVAPLEYNYRTEAEWATTPQGSGFMHGDYHGISVFFRMGDDLFHTYSSYARGCENLTNSYELLDITPYGRQEDWEDSPAGWPQKPTYG